ncbi:MAG: hypothetical protein RIT27_1118 [Pseudomonadota bacterium]|jgi:uncharacterized RDD family membrane protein YckC
MNDNFKSAGLFKRLAAIFYDVLMLIAVLIMAGFFAKLIGFIPPMPIENQTKDVTYWLLRIGFNTYVYLICYFYFAYPWVKTGQTLGMRTWKIKVVNLDGTTLSYKTATIRFFVAILSWITLGFGFWRSLFDKEKRTWHDALSQTRLVSVNYAK